jgi:hypothetical protein
MTYQELRSKLRDDGFINAEIVAIHHQYLMLRHLGIPDEDMVFDREHGLLVHQRSKAKMDAATGRNIAIDVERHTAYDMRDGKVVP